MALDQNDPDNRGPRNDFEVFRVPSKEMLDKYSQAPKDLVSPNPSGGTDISEGKDFGLTGFAPMAKTPAKEFVAPKPVALTPVPPKPAPLPEAPKPVAVNPPIQPIAPKEQEPEDIFSEPLAVDGPGGPQSPTNNNLPMPSEASKNPVAPKNRKWLWITLIIAIILIPVVMLALEWFGVYSFGFSKYLGSPPARLAWLRTKTNFSTFSASFSGSINLSSADLPTAISKWAIANHFDQKTQVNFKGSLVKTSNVISGTWSWENDPTMYFRLENKKLFLQRPNGKWYSMDIGVANIDSYFGLLQTFFNNSGNFTALKPDAANVFSYQAKISNQILGTSSYMTDEPTMMIDLNNRKFSLQKINLLVKPISGANLQIDFTDFNNESVELSNIDQKSVLPGNKEFVNIYDLFNLIVNPNASQATTNVDVNQTAEQKNDVKRKADLAAIAKMLESYKNDHTTYPVAATMIKIESSQDFIDNLTPYLAVGTTWNYADPLWPAKFYGYESADGTTYSLTAVLQNTKDSAAVLTNGLYVYTVTPSGTTP